MQDSVFKRYVRSIAIIIIVGIVVTLFVMPAFSVSVEDNGFLGMLDTFGENLANPFGSLAKVFSGKDENAGYKSTYGNNVKLFWLVYVLCVLYVWYKMKPKREYDNIEHGSSDWATMSERNKTLNKSEGFILAEKTCLPVDRRGNLNLLIAGGSGSGKSASYVIPNATQLLGSYVFTDPKGELYDRTAGYFKKNGYKIQTLNLVKPEYSDAYNPLLHIRNEIDVDIIANTIVKGQSDAKGSDPFWEDMAEILLKALIYYLKARRPTTEQSLASCANLVRAANASTGDNLLGRLMAELPENHPARLNYKSIEIASEKTLSSILSTLQSKLGKFDSKEIQGVTSSNTIEFEALAKEKVALYVIPPDSHSAYNFILTIFFAQMIQQLYDFADSNGGKLQNMVVFMLDEFANIGRIPDFDKKISTSRSRNISFSVIIQTIDQLTDIYEDAAETIMANCDTHLFLGCNSQKTAEYFSKALGEKTIVRDSLSTSRDKDNVKSGSSYSDQIMARPLLTTDEIRRFDPDRAIVLIKGMKPIQEKKYYYFKYPIAKELKACEINHNDPTNVNRGEYSIYNPFIEEQKASMQSMSNTFKTNNTKKKTQVYDEDEKVDVPNINDINIDFNLGDDNKKSSSSIQIDDDDDDEIPQIVSSSKKKKENDFSYDIQKELEAKFDELFGNDSDED